MLLMIVQKTVNYWAEKEIIDQKDSDIYEYGFELILSSVLNMAVVIFFSILINRLVESIALLAVVIPLQSCGGGYHAKTHLRCFLIMYIGWWAAIGIIPYITFLFAILLICLSLAAVFKLAPVVHENVPMSDKQYRKMKLLLRCFSVGIAVVGIAVLVCFGEYNSIGNSIIIGMFAVSLSMFVAKFVTWLKYLR